MSCCVVESSPFFLFPFVIRRQTEALDPDGDATCNICYCDYKNSDMSGLACGHGFCRGCWGEYLRVRITSDGTPVAFSINSIEGTAGLMVSLFVPSSILLSSPGNRLYSSSPPLVRG